MVHDCCDPNVFSVLESHAIEDYLLKKNVPFDRPNEAKSDTDDLIGGDSEYSSNYIKFGFSDDERPDITSDDEKNTNNNENNNDTNNENEDNEDKKSYKYNTCNELDIMNNKDMYSDIYNILVENNFRMKHNIMYLKNKPITCDELQLIFKIPKELIKQIVNEYFKSNDNYSHTFPNQY